MSNAFVLYEYPLNERVRFLLRLEYLFARLNEFIRSPDAQYQHVGITILFEIMDICERADVRTSILQDIERQKKSFSEQPELPELTRRLADLESISQQLSAAGRVGRGVRNNSWLINLKNRFVSQGWNAVIEMPDYKTWQQRPAQVRLAQLQEWAEPFWPLYNAVALLLYNLRSAAYQREVRGSGADFEDSLYRQSYQLVRVWIHNDNEVYPEVVANKYVISIHFKRLDEQLNTRPINGTIDFTLAMCNL